MGLLDSIIKPVSDLISGTVGKLIPDKSAREKAQAELTVKLVGLLEQEFQAKKDIVIAETTGSFLQRSWRPAMMYIVLFLIAHNYILHPYLILIWPQAPILTITQDMWDWITIGTGGYVVSRGAEKSIKLLKNGGS